MGPTFDNLDRLVRIPSGCGEQNMITTAPSVFVSEYLKAFNKPDTQLLATTSRYITVGMDISHRVRNINYSHLTFEHEDNVILILFLLFECI